MNRDGVVHVDGRALAYSELGVTDGPPLIVCHATLSSRLDAIPVGAAAEAGARVVVYDRPGYGDSEYAEPRSALAAAADVEAVADAVGVTTFGVVGISGGGSVAAAAASRFPRAVAALALLSSVGPYYDVPELGELLPAEDVRRENLELGRTDVAALRERAAARCAEYVADVSGRGHHGCVGDVLMNYGMSWGFPPAAIAVPTIVFHGDADDAVPVGVARWWARTLPRCEARIYPGEGHHLLDAHAAEILRDVAARV